MEKDLDRFRSNADEGQGDNQDQNNLFGDDLGLGADFFNDQDVLPNNFDLPQAPSRLEPTESPRQRQNDEVSIVFQNVSLPDQKCYKNLGPAGNRCS